MNKIVKIVAVLGITIAALAAGGIWLGYHWGFVTEQTELNKRLESISPLRENNSSYSFINPLLSYNIPPAIQDKKLIALRTDIINFIATQKNSGLGQASVMMTNLNNGRWIGVGSTQQYNPASMLKVAIMIAYFKKVETDSDLLQTTLVYNKQVDTYLKTNQFNSQSDLVIGKSYTINDLVNHMIIDSDNGAAYLLLGNLAQSDMDAIYSAFNIENPNGKTDFTISPRDYSLFFRVIYSATYLSRDMSEKALGLLSKTTFNDGLVAQLPKSVVVSHKFGEYVSPDNTDGGSRELHDCGIIYIPKNPYFLCVMTRGNDLDELKSTISTISSMVYKERAQ